VAVEKVRFSQNSQNLRDRKCPRKARSPFVGLPNGKFFPRIFQERVFQQPLAISLKTLGRTGFECNGEWVLKKSISLKTAEI
jgi:hypothetical protein